MIHTQVMIVSKITEVMLVSCGYILGKICLLNSLSRCLVPLTICQSSNLVDINFQVCISLGSHLSPAQTLALTQSPYLPFQQEDLRDSSWCHPGKSGFALHAHPWYLSLARLVYGTANLKSQNYGSNS